MDMNLRSLRRQPGGGFTFVPKSQEGNRRNACDHCCLAEKCRVKANNDIHRSWGAGVIVQTCLEYQPPIGFQDAKGLWDGANTLRLGSAWCKRVKTGDKVGLVNTKTGEVIGSATVSRVKCGPRDSIIFSHSKYNHLLISDKHTKRDAAAAITKMLPNIYGNLVWKNAKTATAIYFKDVKLKEKDDG